MSARRLQAARPRQARAWARRLRRLALSAAALSALAAASLVGATSTQTAVANGDTRTLHLYHTHTGESIDATYRVDGHYDPAVLRQLNHFLRDWRNNDEISMDPRLFDTLWEVYRTAGATQPIQIYSAYRSPETNAMLRRRSRAVAEHSQHMLGKAMDTTIPGFPMHLIREVGMKLQRGGVGWYPTMNFVHLDVGGVRSWPRMPYDQLAQLFPDGKTVHVASNGQVLPGYEAARQEIAARGAEAPPAQESGGFFAWLFGGSGSAAREDEEERRAPTAAPTVVASTAPQAATPQLAPPQEGAAQEGAAQEKAAPVTTLAYADRPAAIAPAAAIAAIEQPDAAQGAPGAAASPAPSESRSDVPAAAEALPLPPRRPTDLVAAIDVPMPPMRPAGLSRDVVLASADETVVPRSAGSMPPTRPQLPPLITGGMLPRQSLGYAALPQEWRNLPRPEKSGVGAATSPRAIGLRAALRGSGKSADDAGDTPGNGARTAAADAAIPAGLTGLRRAAHALTLKAAL